jgi:EmrB/QacA subfamily drug resistance transporter
VIDARQRRVGFLVAGCFFMEIMDGTIVSTSAPRIGAALGVTATAVGLVATAYLVTLAVLIPASGWLVNRLGTRKVFLTSIVVFTGASLLCSTSQSLGELVAFRVLQGAGAAMMTPVGRLAVLGTTAKSDLLKMISYIVWPALLAPVIAPLAGGFITTYASWRWLFLINVPLGVVAFAVAVRLIPSVPVTAPPPLDWAGAVLTCLGLGGLTYTASLLAQDPTPWIRVAAIAPAAVVALALAVRHLLRARYPLVDLRTLRIATFRTAVGSGSLSMMAISAVPFLLPLLFENVFGWSAVRSGAVVLFVFVGNIGIKPATTFIMNRWGFRSVLLTACLTLAGSMVALAFVTRQTPVALIVLIAIVSGMARSLGGTAYNTLYFCDVPEQQMAHANALSATVGQLAAGFGVAFVAVALRIGGPLAGTVGHSGPQLAYSIAFLLVALLPLAAIPGITRLHKDAGSAARTVRVQKQVPEPDHA